MSFSCEKASPLFELARFARAFRSRCPLPLGRVGSIGLLPIHKSTVCLIVRSLQRTYYCRRSCFLKMFSRGNNRLSYLSGVGGGNFLIKKSAVHEVSRLHYALHSVRGTTTDRMPAHRKSDRRRDDLCAGGLRKCVFRCVGAQRQTKVEIVKFVVTFVVTKPFFWVISGHFTYEKRRGRESNPRIAVLQTATLPLGYPAIGVRSEINAPR